MENEVFNQIKEEITACTKTVGNVGKLRLIGSTSRVLGLFLLIFTVVLLLFAILSFAAVAAINAMSSVMPVWAAALIMAGAYALLILIAVLCRKPLFVHPFIKLMSKQIRSEEELALRTIEAEHQAEIHYLHLQNRVENATRELSLFAGIISRIWSWLVGKIHK